MDELDKVYYKISDVAEMIGVPASTLRYWESEFPEVSPRRSQSNRRYYTPDDITRLRMINYLVKVKGLRIEAAKEELRLNRANISNRMKIIDILTKTRNELEEILAGLSKRR